MTIHLGCEGLSAGWPRRGRTTPERTLLKDLSLDLEFAEMDDCLPIIGRTGVGKSTMLYVLSGMSVPLAGRVAWQLPIGRHKSSSADRSGPDATPLPTEEIAWSAGSRQAFAPAIKPRSLTFGFLLQDAPMIGCFTVEENLVHNLRLRGVKGSAAELRERAHDRVETMRIEGERAADLLAMYPGRLSGGQRLRMALAIATAHDPVVLFADEPTASLDRRTGIQLLNVVRKWLDSGGPGGRAFVFVTHNEDIIRASLRARRMLRLNRSDGDAQGPLQLEWCETP